MGRTSPWPLRWDVAWTLGLLWVADPLHQRVWQPDVHLFLADRYGRLARLHQERGHRERARALDQKAAHHYRLGGGGYEPPAQAVALPRLARFIRVEAVGRSTASPPDDAA